MASALLLAACDAEPTSGQAVPVGPAAGYSATVTRVEAPSVIAAQTGGRTQEIERSLSADDRRGLANVVVELSRNLVGKARLDGEIVTAVRARSPCVTLFTADGEDVPIAWTEVGNPAGRIEGREEVVDLPSGGSSHRLSTAVGRDADLRSLGTDVLILTCDGED